MRLRSLIFVSSLVLSVAAALSPTAALGKKKCTDRPLRGTSTTTTVIDLATGTGTVDGTFWYTRIGKGTVHVDITSFTFTGPNTVTFEGRETDVTANGDKIFGIDRGSGTLTPTGIKATIIDTIIGGTGRFANAFGTNTITSEGEIVSIVGSVVTMTMTSTAVGRAGTCRRDSPGRPGSCRRDSPGRAPAHF
jgi:hypothetical protein